MDAVMRGGFAGIKFFYVADGSKSVLCFVIINQEDGDMSVLFDISVFFLITMDLLYQLNLS